MSKSKPHVLSASTLPGLTWLLRQYEWEIIQQRDLNTALSLALEAAHQFTGADDAALLEAGESMQVIAAVGGSYQVGRFPVKPDRGIVGRSMRIRQPLLVTDVSQDADYVSVIPETVAQMVLPIIQRDALLGVINLETTSGERFTPETFILMQQFVDRVGLALENARVPKAAQQQVKKPRAVSKKITHNVRALTDRVALALENEDAQQDTRRRVEELQILSDKLRRSERMKSTLIDVAIHDLRNPLGAIRNLADLLLTEDDPMSGRSREMTQHISEAASEALKVVEDLLIIQRIDNSSENATFRALNIVSLLHSIADNAAVGAAERKQVFTVKIDPNPLTLFGEPALLREAFTNLLKNAFKYTPEGGAILFRMFPTADGIEVRVEDNGYGVEAAALPHLFEPFYRAPSAQERGINGTGLGLHIVKQVIEHHGGTVSAESQYGKGTTFIVRLPLRAAPR